MDQLKRGEPNDHGLLADAIPCRQPGNRTLISPAHWLIAHVTLELRSGHEQFRGKRVGGAFGDAKSFVAHPLRAELNEGLVHEDAAAVCVKEVVPEFVSNGKPLSVRMMPSIHTDDGALLRSYKNTRSRIVEVFVLDLNPVAFGHECDIHRRPRQRAFPLQLASTQGGFVPGFIEFATHQTILRARPE